MKKTITVVMSLALTLFANAQTQIGNPGFEDWENVSGGSEPVNWNSFLTAGGPLTSFAANQLENSTDVRPGSTGSTSVKLRSRSTLGIIANGNITLGKINMGSTSPSNSANYNASVISDPNFSEVMTDRPDSLVFWVKYVPGSANPSSGTNFARVKATIHDNYNYRDPEDAAASDHVVGTAVLNFPPTGGWVRKSIPFDYSGPATTPSYILITFTTNHEPGKGSANDFVWIDDVELIYVPQADFTASNTVICAGETVNFTNTSTQYPTDYSWSFPGGSPAVSTDQNPTVTFNTPGTHTVQLTATNQWGSTVKTMQITVNPVYSTNFTYSASSYCTNLAANPVPTTNSAGNFSATPAGLVFANTTTGEINLAASAAGTYTITNEVADACVFPPSSTGTITIFEGADADFSYGTNTICTSIASNPVPTVAQTGVFSATPTGLIFSSATTGEIDMVNSAEGTYVVRHIVNGACPDTVETTITITDTPDATFSYASASYCEGAAVVPTPTFGTGASAGVFSAGNGLSINSSNGQIDLSASVPGSYNITNAIAASGSCPAASYSFDLTIVAAPTVTLQIPQDTVCANHSAFVLSGGTPAGGTYSGVGVAATIFNPAIVTPNTSTTITYTYTDAATTCSNSATQQIYVDACLGIEENTLEGIEVYPNPTSGVVTVKNLNQAVTYQVISLSGSVLATGELSESVSKIDMSTLVNGVYMIQLKSEKSTQILRVVKQ